MPLVIVRQGATLVNLVFRAEEGVMWNLNCVHNLVSCRVCSDYSGSVQDNVK